MNGIFASDLPPLKPATAGSRQEAPPRTKPLQNGFPQTMDSAKGQILDAGDSTIPRFNMSSTPLALVPPSSADPWASADFSFFDSAVLPAAPPATQPKVAGPPKQPQPLLSGRQDQTSHADILTSTSQTSTLPPAPTPTARQGGNSKQDVLVTRVISSLPDLSYMLR